MKLSKTIHVQEMHSAGPEDITKADDEPTFEVRITDAGGGEYVVLNVFEWAIDSTEEVDALAEVIKARLKECQE